jgi:hypothetical protein
MKRPVSLVASLLMVGTLAAGCGAAKAGKAELAQVCADRMGSQPKCACYVDSIEKGLSPEQFAQVAQGAFDNRRMSGMVPSPLMADPAIGSVLADATTSCFT